VIFLEKSREKHQGDQTTLRHELDPHKELTPLSTQNLKTLGLWVLFCMYYSTFSFLLNVRPDSHLDFKQFPPCKVRLNYTYLSR